MGWGGGGSDPASGLKTREQEYATQTCRVADLSRETRVEKHRVAKLLNARNDDSAVLPTRDAHGLAGGRPSGVVKSHPAPRPFRRPRETTKNPLPRAFLPLAARTGAFGIAGLPRLSTGQVACSPGTGGADLAS